jgi:hypothetical protein
MVSDIKNSANLCIIWFAIAPLIILDSFRENRVSEVQSLKILHATVSWKQGDQMRL